MSSDAWFVLVVLGPAALFGAAIAFQEWRSWLFWRQLRRRHASPDVLGWRDTGGGP